MYIKIIQSTANIGHGTILEIDENQFSPGIKIPFKGGLFEITEIKQISENTLKISSANFIAVVKILG